jgi:hypothetical protein
MHFLKAKLPKNFFEVGKNVTTMKSGVDFKKQFTPYA